MANRYFRGQGRVFVGTRDELGEPVSLRDIGNCPELMIETTQDVVEHKESQTGDRRVDLRIYTSTSVNISFTCENTEKENWQLAFQGALGASGATEVIEAFNAPRVDYYIRFEGLNTVENKNEVTVDMFKVSLESAQQIALIGDDLVAFQLRGSVLYDELHEDVGGFFTVTQKDLSYVAPPPPPGP